MANNIIKCCNGCVEPKRHIGCHSTCKEYIMESENNNKIKEKERQEKKRYKNINYY